MAAIHFVSLNVLRSDCFPETSSGQAVPRNDVPGGFSFFTYIAKWVFKKAVVFTLMTNKMHTVLYVGVSSDLTGRVWQHKNKFYPNSFTAKYNCDKLVYYFFYSRIEEAIAVENAIKG